MCIDSHPRYFVPSFDAILSTMMPNFLALSRSLPPFPSAFQSIISKFTILEWESIVTLGKTMPVGNQQKLVESKAAYSHSRHTVSRLTVSYMNESGGFCIRVPRIRITAIHLRHNYDVVCSLTATWMDRSQTDTH